MSSLKDLLKGMSSVKDADVETVNLEMEMEDAVVEQPVVAGVNKGTIAEITADGTESYNVKIQCGIYTARVKVFQMDTLLVAASVIYDEDITDTEQLIGKDVMFEAVEHDNGSVWASLNFMEAFKGTVEFVKMRIKGSYLVIVTRRNGMMHADVKQATSSNIASVKVLMNSIALFLGVPVGQKCNYKDDLDKFAGKELPVEFGPYTKKDGTQSKTSFMTYFPRHKAEEKKSEPEVDDVE